jgi:tRNA-specific 2-thiouridylase
MKRRVKGIGMISGGLDSLLAVAVLAKQGIDILGVHFLNGFAPENLRRRVNSLASMDDISGKRSRTLSDLMGIPIRAIDVSEDFLSVMKDPPHGFGKNVNPCIDCRIFLLRKAAEIMRSEGFDFIFTGEVLGQRPMSQHMIAMRSVEKESGLAGRLLRPLCAKLLKPTEIEEEGLVDREMLLDIQGRSRKRQLSLAEELGVKGFGAPAGGCALTDINYARKYVDHVEHSGGHDLTVRDTVLFSTGRHLRLSDSVKIVVGRKQEENEYFEAEWTDHYLAMTPNVPGPTVVVIGDPVQDDFPVIAAVTARYSDGKKEDTVRVEFILGEGKMEFDAAPAPEEDIYLWRV